MGTGFTYTINMLAIGDSGLNRLLALLDRLDSNIDRVQADVAHLGSSMQQMAARGSSSVSNLMGNFKSLIATVGGAAVVFGSLGAAANMDSIQRTMNFAGGSAQEGAKNIAFVRDTVSTLGLPLKESLEGFKTLQGGMMGTGITANQTRDIFMSMGKGAAVMGMSADDTKGAFMALSQMASKGKVSAEELRGQLGERLPGAFNIAARSIGVTTTQLDKMLEGGKVMAADFLPKFAAEMERTFGPGVAGATNSATANFNRFHNSVLDLKVAFGEGLLPVVLQLLNGYLIPSLTWITANGEAIKQWATYVFELGSRAAAVYGIFWLWGTLTSTLANIPMLLQGITLKLGDVYSATSGLVSSTWGLIKGMAIYGYQAALSVGQAIRSVALYVFTLNGAKLAQIQMAVGFAWGNIVLGFGAMQTASMRFLTGLIPAMWTWITTLNFAAIGQGLLNTLMLANPVGLVIAGVAGLIAIFYGLFKLVDYLLPGFWDGFTSVFKSVWNFIKKWFIDPLMSFFGWLADAVGISMPTAPATTTTEAFVKYNEKDPLKIGETGVGGPRALPTQSTADALSKYGSGSATGGSGAGSNGSPKATKGVEAVTSGGSKNITINLGKFMDSMVVNAANVTEGADAVADIVLRKLTQVVNSANQVQTQ